MSDHHTFEAVTDSNITRKPNYADYENSTYAVISKVAYLIGVPKWIFENEYEPPKMEWFEKLQKDKNARIIRNLCMLRTAIERNFKSIYHIMRYDARGLYSLPDYIPQECLDELGEDGISIVRSNSTLSQYIIEINRHISNRINNCKTLFPLWLNWEYIKKLFIMPNGLTDAGIKAAAADYYANKNHYPY